MIDKNSEAYRHQCEVRWLLRLAEKNGKAATSAYLAQTTVKPRSKQLEADAIDQWRKGNRGHNEEWR
jgi:hypothetical protein